MITQRTEAAIGRKVENAVIRHHTVSGEVALLDVELVLLHGVLEPILAVIKAGIRNGVSLKVVAVLLARRRGHSNPSSGLKRSSLSVAHVGD